MQGMRFLIISEQKAVNHGIITQQITPEKYLCTFVRNPQTSRVIDIEEIQGWNLFPNDDQMNAFILALQAATGESQKPVDNSHKKPPAIKATKKKATKKKATK